MIQFVVKLSLYLSSEDNMVDLLVSVIIVSFSFTLYISSVHGGGKFLKILKLKKWLPVSLSSFELAEGNLVFKELFFLTIVLSLYENLKQKLPFQRFLEIQTRR